MNIGLLSPATLALSCAAAVLAWITALSAASLELSGRLDALEGAEVEAMFSELEDALPVDSVDMPGRTELGTRWAIAGAFDDQPGYWIREYWRDTNGARHVVTSFIPDGEVGQRAYDHHQAEVRARLDAYPVAAAGLAPR